MSGGVRVTGLTELIQQLTDAPKHVRDEGMGIVRDETEQAAKDYIAGLPTRTGRLVRMVRTSYPAATSVLVGLVKSAAAHSHLVDRGTKQRRTASGANRGRMPGLESHARMSRLAPVRRERMYRRLAELLRTLGFEVQV